MTQQEWDNASEEERNAEIERCRTDLYYHYMTYYWKDGMRKYTKEEFDSIQGFIATGGRRVRRFDPIRLDKKIEWKKPEENKSPYDGHAMRVKWDTDPDMPWQIPISLALENPELYQKLLDAQNKQLEAWRKFFPLNIQPQGKAIFTSIQDNEAKDWQAMKDLWDANTTFGYSKATEHDTEDDAKDHFKRLTKLQRYFLPAYKSTKDE